MSNLNESEPVISRESLGKMTIVQFEEKFELYSLCPRTGEWLKFSGETNLKVATAIADATTIDELVDALKHIGSLYIRSGKMAYRSQDLIDAVRVIESLIVESHIQPRGHYPYNLVTRKFGIRGKVKSLIG